MPKIQFINAKAGEAVVLRASHHGAQGISSNMQGVRPLFMLVLTHPDADHIQRFELPQQKRQQDYTRIGSHTVACRSHSAAKPTAVAMPVVIGSPADIGFGGDGGDGGGSGDESGDGGGDDDPPTTAGPAPSGDGQHPISLSLLLLVSLLLLALSIFGDILSRPVQGIWWLYRSVPDLRHVWYCLKFLFPDVVRRDLYRPHLIWLFRHRRLARRERLAFRVWMAVCLRTRTAVLLLRRRRQL